MMISIITATYNSGKTLADTLESILRQSYADYEVIVQDGGSKDNTLDIVKAYEPKFEGRMKWVSEKDKGIYDAMNKGLSRASGEVVGILNSDDFYTSDDCLQTIADAFAQRPELDAVYGDIHYVHPDNLSKCVRYYSSARFSKQRMRGGWIPAHPSFYAKRSCYERFGMFDTSYKIAADFENLLRLIYLGNITTQYLQKDFVTMRTGGASTMGIKSHLRIVKEHRKAFRDNGVRISWWRYVGRYVEKGLGIRD